MPVRVWVGDSIAVAARVRGRFLRGAAPRCASVPRRGRVIDR